MIRLFCLALLLSAVPTAFGQAPVAYEIAFPNRVHHEAEVTLRLTDLPDGPVTLRMSRSSPGRYALHEFAKNVYRLRVADSAGDTLATARPNLHTWRVGDHDGALTVTYTLYGDRADGTYTGIDGTHAHLNMPATFLWAEELADRPVRVRFERPEPGWRIATQLAPTDDPETFTAPNLYYFMDSPTEISDHALREWTVARRGQTATIRLAVHHTGTEAEVDAYAAMAEQVVAEQIGVFEALPGFDYGTYTFLACYLPWVSGDGMEHRNSTILTSTRSIAQDSLRLLGTLSHEFFHAWNVERLRPEDLEPFDFTDANMTNTLWFAEGFTSYYDDLFIHRAGLTSLDDYASGLDGTLNYVLNSPGRRFFSAAEMSQQAPFVDAATSVDPTNRFNTFISYYSWGAMIGLGLDLTLRGRFGVSVDGYLRALWQFYGQTEIPYTLADLEEALALLTGNAAFARDFFDRYVRGHEVVDYAALFEQAGLALRPANPGAAYLGPATLAAADSAVVVDGPTRIGSPLYDAGLDRGARLLRLAGQPVATPEAIDAIVAAQQPGDVLAVVFEQRGRRVETTLTLTADPTLELVTFEAASRPVTDAMRTFRAAWLGSKQ